MPDVVAELIHVAASMSNPRRSESTLLVFSVSATGPDGCDASGGSRLLLNRFRNSCGVFGDMPLSLDRSLLELAPQGRNPFRQCKEGVSAMSRPDFGRSPEGRSRTTQPAFCDRGPALFIGNGRCARSPPGADVDGQRHVVTEIQRCRNDSVTDAGPVHW